MAYRKTDENSFVTISEKDYLTLIRDHITMNAIRISGIIDKDPVYKALQSIMKDARVETHIHPIKKNYR